MNTEKKCFREDQWPREYEGCRQRVGEPASWMPPAEAEKGSLWALNSDFLGQPYRRNVGTDERASGISDFFQKREPRLHPGAELSRMQFEFLVWSSWSPWWSVEWENPDFLRMVFSFPRCHPFPLPSSYLFFWDQTSFDYLANYIAYLWDCVLKTMEN